MRDIIIIGAGASGLMAANVLREQGRNALVLESRDRVGGRILTAGSDPVIEIGAEFLHGETPVTDRMLRRHGLADYELKLQYARFEGTRLKSDPDFWERLARVISGIRASGRDQPFSDYLSQDDRHSALDKKLAEGFVEGFDAADLDHISMHALKEMKDQVADPKVRRLRRVLKGYGALVDAMAEPIASQIQYRHKVDRIEWRPGHVRVDGVITGTRRRFRLLAKTAIITLPLSILQDIEVWPRPAAFQHLLDQSLMGHVMKWVVRLDSEFFKPYREEGFPFVTSPDLNFSAWWGPDPIHWPTITAWAGGKRARALAALSEAEQLKRLIEDLAKIRRVSRARMEKWIETAYQHNWSGDPHAQGAYSYPAVRTSVVIEKPQTAYDHTLFLAGEAFHTEMSGTVEGALSTGEIAAKKVLSALTRGVRSRISKSASQARTRSTRSRSRP